MAVGAHGSQLAGTEPHVQMATKLDTAIVTIHPQLMVDINAAEVTPNRWIAMNVTMAMEDASIDALTTKDLIRVVAILDTKLHHTGNTAIVCIHICDIFFKFHITARIVRRGEEKLGIGTFFFYLQNDLGTWDRVEITKNSTGIKIWLKNKSILGSGLWAKVWVGYGIPLSFYRSS